MAKYNKRAIMRAAWAEYKLIKAAPFVFLQSVTFADILKGIWANRWMFEEV